MKRYKPVVITPHFYQLGSPSFGALSQPNRRQYPKEGGKKYLKAALKATETYHHELLKRIDAGEKVERMALEKAQWVNSLTDILSFDVMHFLCKVLIKCSLAANKRERNFSCSGSETKAEGVKTMEYSLNFAPCFAKTQG